MKGMVKGIIIGIVIIAIGLGLTITALALSGWKINPEFEMQTYTAENENTAIDITLNTGTFKTQFYDGDRIIIEYPSSSNTRVSISENDGSFRFEAKTKFFSFLGPFVGDIPDTVIKLPSAVRFSVRLNINAGKATLADGAYSRVSIDMDAGDFDCGNIECDDFTCDLAAGQITVNRVKCDSFKGEIDAGKILVHATECGTADLRISAGDLNMGFTGDKSEYGITTRVSAGSCNVDGQSGTTDKRISIKVSAGSARLSFNV